MKFRISRASKLANLEKPCEEAELSNIKLWDERYCNEETFNRKHGKMDGLWKSKGKNHKTLKNGNIAREVGQNKVWTINISTFKELTNFLDKYGESIINTPKEHEQYGTITIYDDYLG